MALSMTDLLELSRKEAALQAGEPDTTVAQAAAQPIHVEAQYAVSIQATTSRLLDSVSGEGTPNNKALVSGSEGVGAPPPSHKGLGSGSPLPNPNLPPSKDPDASIPSNGQEYNIWGTGYLDKLSQLIDRVENNPRDPTAAWTLFAYVMNLTKAGLMNGDAQQLLSDDHFDFGDFSYFVINMVMENVYYRGYTDSQGNTYTGPAAMQHFRDDNLAILQALPSNEYTQMAVQGFGTWDDGTIASFYAGHHDATTGDLTWSYTDPLSGITMTYDWTNSTGQDDQEMIQQIIYTQGLYNNSSPTPNSWYGNVDLNSILRDYRVRVLAQIWAATKNIGLLFMMLMTMYDNQSQSTQGGLGDTTNLMTDITNKYVSPIVNDVEKFGTLTQDATGQKTAEDFRTQFMNAYLILNMETQASSISGSANTNVFEFIGSQTVTVNGKTDTLFNFMNTQKYPDPNTLVQALNALNTPSTGSGMSQPSISQGFINAIQQFGSLVTGTSKTETTLEEKEAATDEQIVKLGSSQTDATGMGIVGLIMAILKNMISN